MWWTADVQGHFSVEIGLKHLIETSDQSDETAFLKLTDSLSWLMVINDQVRLTHQLRGHPQHQSECYKCEAEPVLSIPEQEQNDSSDLKISNLLDWHIYYNFISNMKSFIEAAILCRYTAQDR